MQSVRVIGLDLGGTNIKARLVNRSGAVLAAHDSASLIEQGPDRVISRMVEAVQAVCDAAAVSLRDVVGVGVASPGPLDMTRGVIERSVNLPGWVNVPLSQRLESSLRRPVTLINDARAACFGEHWTGAGKGIDHLAMFTIGTGLGGGMIFDGKLLFGHFGQAGEFGHIIVDAGGRMCGCGQRGCLEAYASESHMTRRGIELGVFHGDGACGVPALLAAAKAGSEPAQLIWDECCSAIATACVTLQHVMNPRLILLGGGVAAAGDIMLQPVRDAISSLTWQMTHDVPTIELAALGHSAGAIGAAGWLLSRRGWM